MSYSLWKTRASSWSKSSWLAGIGSESSSSDSGTRSASNSWTTGLHDWFDKCGEEWVFAITFWSISLTVGSSAGSKSRLKGIVKSLFCFNSSILFGDSNRAFAMSVSEISSSCIWLASWSETIAVFYL